MIRKFFPDYVSNLIAEHEKESEMWFISAIPIFRQMAIQMLCVWGELPSRPPPPPPYSYATECGYTSGHVGKFNVAKLNVAKLNVGEATTNQVNYKVKWDGNGKYSQLICNVTFNTAQKYFIDEKN